MSDTIEKAAEAVKSLPVLYVIIDRCTAMPYLDEDMSVYIFSSREYAESCIDYYAQQLRQWYTAEIPGVDMTAFLGNLFYCTGALRAILDNGQNSVTLPREALVAPPDTTGLKEEEIPVTNQAFSQSLLAFMEEYYWRLNYPEKANVLKSKESRMIQEFGKARFLLPIKGPENGSFTKGSEFRVAGLSNEEGQAATPAFTDWSEFDKMYDRSEWQCLVVGARDLKELRNDGVVLNPGSTGFFMNKRMITQMLEICAEDVQKQEN